MSEQKEEREERVRAKFTHYKPSDDEVRVYMNFEDMTGFAPSGVDLVVQRSDFISAMSGSVRAFSNWAVEIADALDERIQDLVNRGDEGRNNNAGLAGPACL